MTRSTSGIVGSPSPARVWASEAMSTARAMNPRRNTLRASCGPGTAAGEVPATSHATGRRQEAAARDASETPRVADIWDTPIRSRQKTNLIDLIEVSWHYPQSAGPRRQSHRTHHQR